MDFKSFELGVEGVSLNILFLLSLETFTFDLDPPLTVYRRKQLLTLTEDKLRKSPDAKMSDRSAIESVGRAGLSYTAPDVLNQKSQVVGSSLIEFLYPYRIHSV